MVKSLTFREVFNKVYSSLRGKFPTLLMGMVAIGLVFTLFSLYVPLSHFILFIQPLTSLVSLSLKRSEKALFSYKGSELVDLFFGRLLPVTVVSLLCTAGIGYIGLTIINADISLSYKYFLLVAEYVISMFFYIPLSLFFYFGMVQAETIGTALKDAFRIVKENLSLLFLIMLLFAAAMSVAIILPSLAYNIPLYPFSWENLILIQQRCLFIACAQIISILFLSFYIEMYIMAKERFFINY